MEVILINLIISKVGSFKFAAGAVFILGFEKSGGSARKLWKNVGDFQKVWGIIRWWNKWPSQRLFFLLTINDTLSLYYDAQVQK